MRSSRPGRLVAGAGVLAALVLLAACQSTGRGTGGGSVGRGADPVDPQQLLGAGEGQVSALLGAPELKRQEAPAEVWQYRSATCVLDVFLYARAGGGRTVTHYETRHRRHGSVNAATCLGEIVASRGRRTPAG